MTLLLKYNDGYTLSEEMPGVKELLQSAEWTETECPQVEADIPHVTHFAVIKSPGVEFRIVRLSDGRHIVPENALQKLLTKLRKDRKCTTQRKSTQSSP